MPVLAVKSPPTVVDAVEPFLFTTKPSEFTVKSPPTSPAFNNTACLLDIFVSFAVKFPPLTLIALLSATKLIIPLGLEDVIDEFAIWIDELLLNFILFVFVGSAEAAIKLDPSFVTNEILLPVILEAFTSIPFAMILRSPPEKTLPEFNAITLYVLSLNTGLFK